MRHSPHRSFAARASALAVLPALAVLLVSLVAAPPAVADSMGFDARPSPGSPNAELGFFKIDAQPGAALQRIVVITNRTTKTKVIDLAACDGAAAVYGGVAYSDNAKKPSAVGSWIKLSSVQVDVPPNTSVQVPFEISVPADATSGTHLGGISMWSPPRPRPPVRVVRATTRPPRRSRWSRAWCSPCLSPHPVPQCLSLR